MKGREYGWAGWLPFLLFLIFAGFWSTVDLLNGFWIAVIPSVLLGLALLARRGLSRREGGS